MRKKCTTLQNIVRVAWLLQWKPAVMSCAYVILNIVGDVSYAPLSLQVYRKKRQSVQKTVTPDFRPTDTRHLF